MSRLFCFCPITLAMCIATMLIGCTSLENDGLDVRSDTFKIGPAPKLSISNDNCFVRLYTGLENEIVVHAAIKDQDRMQYYADLAGNLLRVEATRKGGPNLADSIREVGADITIWTPEST